MQVKEGGESNNWEGKGPVINTSGLAGKAALVVPGDDRKSFVCLRFKQG